MCEGSAECHECTSCQNKDFTTMQNTLPTPGELTRAMPVIAAIASANPAASRTALAAQGFPVQGIADSGLADYAYKQFAAGTFNVLPLSSIKPVTNTLDQKGLVNRTAAVPQGKFSWDNLGMGITSVSHDFSQAIQSIFGGGNNNQLPPMDNSATIAGMQKQTVVIMAVVAIAVIGLLVYLKYRKK